MLHNYQKCLLFYLLISTNTTTTNVGSQTTVNNTSNFNNSQNNFASCPESTVLNNDNNNTICEEKSKKHSLNDTDTLAFYYITIILTVLAYAAVLPIVYKKRQPSSVFVFSLAIADAFIGLVIVPIKISEVYGSVWQKDIVFCRIVNSITIFGIALAATNMVVLSVDRGLYFAIPMKYRGNVTINRAIIACLISYLFSLPALLPAVGVGGLSANKELPFCAFKYSLSRMYMWCISVVYFFLPILIIIPIQIDIIRRTKIYYNQHRKFVKNNPDGAQREKQLRASMKREVRIQRMFLLIIIMFFFCWGPFVVGLIFNLVATHLITPFFIQLMRIMLFINSFVNPAIIFFANVDFKSCISALKRKKRHGTLKSSSTTIETRF